ncbi:sorting nexin-13-like [Tigriopus californicus]|uniref:sorting nexin-13-like n=1 Tax=Tigriopus californicus TaxID=6832 RepID=UPI0027DA5CDD|nr:sorting nexin-13-like [Tigriopus californicus]
MTLYAQSFLVINMERKWIFIALALGFVSMGTQGLVLVVLCSVLLVTGVLCTLFALSDTVQFRQRLLDSTQRYKQISPGSVAQPFKAEAQLATDPSLTGYGKLDEELDDILNYVFRDYVYSWLFSISHSDEFVLQVRDTLHVVLTSLSERVRAVDWMPFLTTRLVDDVATHVRLFKRARTNYRTKKDVADNGKITDLESLFFDAEVSMERDVCRDLVCTIHQEEITYLQDVSELLLFLLLPQADFRAGPLRTVVRELLVNVILRPILDVVSDPDWINQNIVWLYKDSVIKPDLFSTTLRLTESVQELQATRDIVSDHINHLRSNDSKGEEDSSLKQQLNSLLNLRKSIDNRINRLQSGSDTDSIGVPTHVDWRQMIAPGLTLFPLPIEVVLKNNIALSYFIDYMSSIGCQSYIFFYLNIEGWRVSAEQQILQLDLEAFRRQSNAHAPERDGEEDTFVKVELNRKDILDKMREAAHSIYEEYLSEKASPRLKVDDSVVKRLLFKIRTEPPDLEWFCEIQDLIFDKFQTDERFLESFKKSMGYVKLLAELDLPKDRNSKFDLDDQSSVGEEPSIYDSSSIHSADARLESQDEGGPTSLEEVEDLSTTLTASRNSDSGLGSLTTSSTTMKSHKRTISDCSLLTAPSHRRNPSQGSLGSFNGGNEFISIAGPVLRADIEKVESVREHGKTFAIYTVHVTSRDPSGVESFKYILRRYSDFHALHEKIKSLFPPLSQLAFPSKRAFGNLERDVLQRRLNALNQYFQEILRIEVLTEYPKLLEILQKFLEDPNHGKERAQFSQVAKAVGSVRSSVKSMSNAVTSVPGQLFVTVDNVVDGISKVLLSKPVDASTLFEDSRVGAGLEMDNPGDNIPLRVILLFMDEVFDLRERNQWIRRYIISFLRQVLKAMFGDIVNRRIIEYFAHLTSPSTLSTYLKACKESLWPQGYPAAPRPQRDESTKMRTRVAARVALYSSFSEDLKRAIGSETSRAGLQMLFDMVQHPVLNKRLAILLLEGFLGSLFHEENFPALFKRLHSRSGRVRDELKNSHRKGSDLRRN